MEELGATIQGSNRFSSFPYTRGLIFMLTGYNKSIQLQIFSQPFFGISWAHNIAGHYNPCQASIVKNLLEAAKRILGKSIAKKDPITADHLRKLVEKFDTPTASLLEIRFLVMCLLALDFLS